MESEVVDKMSITDLFDQFIEASTMKNVLSIFHRILSCANLKPCEFNLFFPQLKRSVMISRVRKNWKAKALFSKIDKKAAHRCYSNTKLPTPTNVKSSDILNNSHQNSQECLDESITSASGKTYYNNNALQNFNCLIIGSGPAGLRTAIELQLLGASRVVVVEKRSRFSRNNVLHLWPFVIDDLKSLGAKKFYGKFCAGSIDHISIRQLQLILLKICLMIGCDFRDSCSYLYLCPASIKRANQDENKSDNVRVNESSKTDLSNHKCDLEVIKTNVLKDFVGFFTVEQEKSHVEDFLSLNSDKNSTTNKKISLSMSDVQNEFNTSKLVQEESNEIPASIYTSDSLPTNLRTKTPVTIQPTLGRENLRGARAHFQSDHEFQERELHSYEWDVIVGADGRRNTLSRFFPRKEFRGRLAIAITANFINRQTPAEASVSEISGLSFIYNQDMFNALAYDTNILLENICYYKDDTHYFVMTAKKKSLLERGVLIKDYPVTQDLLADNNVDKQALLKYAKDAAYWTTGLEPLDFALNHYGQEDCAMFDFTSMYAASNACKALRTTGGGLALVGLVGDSLLEPFWPTGSGCARGFLSSFDAAWMCRQWAINKCAVIDFHNSISSRSGRNKSPNTSLITKASTYDKMALTVIAERESIYRILAQTTSENLQQNYSHWTLNPHSRYPNLNRHLVLPSQVEHLITDNEGKSNILTADKTRQAPNAERRRIKSPANKENLRKSPKKLKSAGASPVSRAKGRIQPSTFKAPKSKSRYELNETYLQFEESYKNLAEYDNKGKAEYISYRRQNCDPHDDFFDSSLSGTLPSSNNLISLEARRARDIDECLRQRRQKTQINVVRDQLMIKLRGESLNRSDEPTGCGAVLFNELRRLKEQQLSGKENNTARAVNGPLTMLNSIRRCASFAERVKSFESKLGISDNQADSTPVTPKTPTDNIRNLPHFTTLQELFVCNSTLNAEPKKSKIPIMKLSKDDWNVKCWEKRLVNHRQKGAKDFCVSTRSLNKTSQKELFSSQTNIDKPEKQVEVFKDRIKEMAEKLKKTRDNTMQRKNETSTVIYNSDFKSRDSSQAKLAQSKGWVSHLRKELTKVADSKRPQNTTRQAMNPILPNKPIKKLFADDDEDNGIDVYKHYDHLCINKPTNKYLPKNGYSSHLVRSKYNSITSKVINRAPPSTASKQAYLNLLASRGSSASSTLSDYSTNTGGSSSGGGGGGVSIKESASSTKKLEMNCFRCNTAVDLTDKLSLEDSYLHKNCLACSNCGITLRTNELQHYLEMRKDSNSSNKCSFVCAICEPTIRIDLKNEAENRLALAESKWNNFDANHDPVQNRLRSREDFLNEKINYNELYKNIISDNIDAREKIKRLPLSSKESAPINNVASTCSNTSVSSSQISKPHASSLHVVKTKEVVTVSPSPVRVTLPLRFVVNEQLKNPSQQFFSKSTAVNPKGRISYRVAKSEIVDGSEQVTLILPSNTPNLSKELRLDEQEVCREQLMDEEEMQRIIHIDNYSLGKSGDHGVLNSTNSNDKHQDLPPLAKRNSSSNDNEDDSEASDEAAEESRNEGLSDASSKLNSPLTTDNSDDLDNNEQIDQNSTYEDFLTSEEFGAASEPEVDYDDAEENDKVLLAETGIAAIGKSAIGELQDVKTSNE